MLSVGGCGAQEPEVMLADGRGLPVSEWGGRWLVINYWAEWCAPCRKEIPELNHLHHEQAGEVMVLGVNYDGLTGEKLTTLIDEMGIEFPVLVHDPRERWQQDLPQVLPSTLIIDPEGQLQRVLVGPQSLEDFSRAMVLTSEL